VQETEDRLDGLRVEAALDAATGKQGDGVSRSRHNAGLDAAGAPDEMGVAAVFAHAVTHERVGYRQRRVHVTTCTSTRHDHSMIHELEAFA
jgi:hypothetical protein